MTKLLGTLFVLSAFIVELYGQSMLRDDQMLKAKIELGRRLFYDADLSINGTMSCATCHEQRRAFSDGNQAHPGALGDLGIRNVPGLSNIGEFKNLTWAHNRLSGLAEQSLMPIRGTHPVEMAMNGYEGEIAKSLSPNPCYQKLFSIAFPHEKGLINLTTVSQALESFEKRLISDNSIYDQSIKKRQPLPTKEAEIGKKLFFGTAKCSSCHSTPLFSDDYFHNVQPKNRIPDPRFNDYGLSDITGNPKDKNLFRTPSLRNATLTAPYWHDGSAKNLKDAILKHDLKINQSLSTDDIQKINAFIETLTDITFVNNNNFGKPSKECSY